MEIFPEMRPAILTAISPDTEGLDEIEELAESAGYQIVERVVQNRNKSHPRFYLGPGKAEELEPEEGVETVIVPRELTPDQIFSMGRATGLKIVDRIRLILEIFHRRAKGPEAKLQVELADLRYQLPVVREYVHKGKLSERPGFMGGGEYRVDYYYDMIRRRMSRIEEELDSIRERRSRTRKRRKRSGSNLVAIAGYTNAGKSTLINSLLEDDRGEKETETDDHMFTTLSTTTRRMKGGRRCLISDTVGFIRDLPPWLIEGFMSTLEEVLQSDMILLVVDISEEDEVIQKKLHESLEILSNRDSRGSIILVGNKLDLVEGDPVPEILEENLISLVDADMKGVIDDVVVVSAFQGERIDQLIERIHERLPDLVRLDFKLPMDGPGSEALSRIEKRWGRVERIRSGDSFHGIIDLEERWARSAAKLVKRAGGTYRMESVGEDGG